MCVYIEKFQEFDTTNYIRWNWNDNPSNFYFFAMRRKKLGQLFGLVILFYFIFAQKQCVCKSSSLKKCTFTKELWNFIQDSGRLTNNKFYVHTIYMENYVFKNISQFVLIASIFGHFLI